MRILGKQSYAQRTHGTNWTSYSKWRQRRKNQNSPRRSWIYSIACECMSSSRTCCTMLLSLLFICMLICLLSNNSNMNMHFHSDVQLNVEIMKLKVAQQTRYATRGAKVQRVQTNLNALLTSDCSTSNGGWTSEISSTALTEHPHIPVTYRYHRFLHGEI